MYEQAMSGIEFSIMLQLCAGGAENTVSSRRLKVPRTYTLLVLGTVDPDRHRVGVRYAVIETVSGFLFFTENEPKTMNFRLRK